MILTLVGYFVYSLYLMIILNLNLDNITLRKRTYLIRIRCEDIVRLMLFGMLEIIGYLTIIKDINIEKLSEDHQLITLLIPITFVVANSLLYNEMNPFYRITPSIMIGISTYHATSNFYFSAACAYHCVHFYFLVLIYSCLLKFQIREMTGVIEIMRFDQHIG